MLTDELDYELPLDRIAQTPLHPRDHAKMLVAIDPAGGVSHMQIKDLPSLLGPGDLLVLNETKVIPARLELYKPTGGRAEVLLLEPLPVSTDESSVGDPASANTTISCNYPRNTGQRDARSRGREHEEMPEVLSNDSTGLDNQGGTAWLALVRPGRRLREGMTLYTSDQIPLVTIGMRHETQPGVRVVYLHDEQAAHHYGRIALPPYIHSHGIDLNDYQTVYARSLGSVAAPTAGLHLSKETLDQSIQAGANVATVDLKIGLDTFRPIHADRIDDHVIHSEMYRVSKETLAQCQEARRVVAVGTTVVRALESAACSGILEGRTSLFIKPGYRFKLVDVLLTNFHVPRSSLLALVHAFIGPKWKELYRMAIENGYRFLSFGDAMLIARSELSVLDQISSTI